MSELFDEDPRATAVGRRGSGRSRALVITAVVLVLLFFGLSTFSSIYTERLWFSDLGYGSVFSRLLWTRVALFVVFGLLMALVTGLAMAAAYRSRPFFHPNNPEQNGLDRYREVVTPIRTWLVVGISLLLGVFAGTSATGQWRTYLLWRNGGSFGVDDAQFGRDIGWFVFDLPWWHYLVDFGMAVLVISLIANAVVHYLYGGIRLQSPTDRLSGPAQVQLSALLGLFVLLKAADYWLDRFDLVHESGDLITGITYTDDKAVLPAKNILMGIAVVCAVLFFLNVWRRTWMLPSVGIALLALSAVLLGLIWPAMVQQFQVNPSEPEREEPYIARNIAATRAAYDLDQVEVESFTDRQDAATDAAVQDVGSETASVPLVDPQVVNQSFEQFQQGRNYYSVAPVLDVDRYEIGDRERALVLGVRELDQDGIEPGDANWSNLHTVYTHGNGLIAAYANQRPEDDTESSTAASDATELSSADDKDGGLEWAEGIREAGQDDLSQATGGFEPRVYFGEQSPEYSVVGKEQADDKDVELNLPTGEDEQTLTTYDGKGGVPVGSAFNQLMYAIKFGEPNFLLSGRVNANSEVLYDRTPTERVEKVAPWLTVDSDPYPAVVGGRITWIVDAYTTTDRYPGAQRESFATMTDDSLQTSSPGLQTLPTDEVNYMRNAVKATVDAYDGTVTLYAWDETDPILQAWRSAFPDTVRDRSEISEELEKHLRYPEDLFKVQRYQFARYHVEDARDFYQGSDRWEVPEDPDEKGKLQPPYRLFVDNPGVAGEDETFSLTSVFVPYDKSNLASFVSVDSDATADSYGTIRVLQLPGETTNGPGLVANDLRSDPDIADQIANFNRSEAKPVYGNLLTLPVGDGLMFVQPVYAQRTGETSSSPILRFVLVKYGDSIGYGATLGAALRDAGVGSTSGGAGTGTDPGDGGTTPPDPDPTTSPGTQSLDELLDQAAAQYDAVEQARQDGDLGAYQDAVEKLGDLLQRIEAARAAEDGGSGG